MTELDYLFSLNTGPLAQAAHLPLRFRGGGRRRSEEPVQVEVRKSPASEPGRKLFAEHLGAGGGKAHHNLEEHLVNRVGPAIGAKQRARRLFQPTLAASLAERSEQVALELARGIVAAPRGGSGEWGVGSRESGIAWRVLLA